MSASLSRAEALRVLGLDVSAGHVEVKRAYRRLAREVHPDVGGDPARFQEVLRAYERLRHEGSSDRAAEPRGSRPQEADWAEPPTKRFSRSAADVSAVDWTLEVPSRSSFRVDHDRLAILLAQPGPGPVRPLAGRSRGPRSFLNRFIPLLDPDLTATWRIDEAKDRGLPGHDLELSLRVWSRSGRRRIDGAAGGLQGWTVEKGSSSATLRRVLHPSRDRRVTAVRAASTLEAMLEAIAWPLDSWVVTLPGV